MNKTEYLGLNKPGFDDRPTVNDMSENMQLIDDKFKEVSDNLTELEERPIDFTIADNTITTAMIRDQAVTGPKIANLGVGTNQIATASVTNAKMANSSISVNNLQDNAVTTVKIADLGVTGAKIANGTIPSTKLASNLNVPTATRLQNARTINGVSFDGSQNITITSSNQPGTVRNVRAVRINATSSNFTANLPFTVVPTRCAVDVAGGTSGGGSVFMATIFNVLTATTISFTQSVVHSSWTYSITEYW